MAKKKLSPESYIGIELSLAEEQLKIYKSWLAANPYNTFKDRIEWKQTANGGAMPMVVSTIESQQKNHRDTLKDYLSLLSAIEGLREKEAIKAQAVGGRKVANIMEDSEDD